MLNLWLLFFGVNAEAAFAPACQEQKSRFSTVKLLLFLNVFSEQKHTWQCFCTSLLSFDYKKKNNLSPWTQA